MARFTVPSILAGLLYITQAAARVAGQDAVAAACEFLDTSLANNTVMPTEADYTGLTEMNWVEPAWATPTCIIRPASSEELSEAINYLVSQSIKFAVRSGGHSVVPLAANIDDGVLIDMSIFGAVEYDAEKEVAVVGSGLRWGKVYQELDQHNVTVVGGRVLDVGVGGLALGSGLSYLSDLYGLVCDNVVNFEVVLGNGSIVNANAEENADLWWALKGGANNFGIVTKFTLTTYPIQNVWGGVKAYTLAELPALFEALLAYQTVAEKDPYANLMLQAFPTNATLPVVLNIVYMKPEESPEAFSMFYDIPTAADTTTLQTLTEFMASQSAPDLPRIDWYATSFKPDEALYATVQEILTTAPELAEIQSLQAGSIAIGWQPISAGLVEAGRERGGNALGLESANQTWLVLDVGWWNEADDAAARENTKSLIDKVEAASQEADRYVDYIFMNDASIEQPVIQHYGADNVERLRAVQLQYDPDLVFQELVPGGFKVPHDYESPPCTIQG